MEKFTIEQFRVKVKEAFRKWNEEASMYYESFLSEEDYKNMDSEVMSEEQTATLFNYIKQQ